jgi:hypothetical protein
VIWASSSPAYPDANGTRLSAVVLGYHARRYGKIAIGFHRHALTKGGFGPVFYQRFDSPLPSNLYALWSKLHEVYARKLHKAIEETTRPLENEPKTLNEDEYSEYELTLGSARYSDFLLEEAAGALMHVLSYVKTFKDSEFDTIYTEREWRSIEPFNFAYDDVSMIVLPREGGHFERFVAEVETIGIPRTVPIVAWEDLVEH